MQDDRELETALSYYRLLHGAPEPQQKPKKPAKTQKPKPKGQQSARPPVTLELFDFDCNLTHSDLNGHVEELMQSAAAVGVTQMLVPGATLAESRQCIELCGRYPSRLFPTSGVHPYNATAVPTSSELQSLAELTRLPSVRAVGECGLDYSPSFPEAALQQTWFSAQLELACELDKPLFLHERLAHDDFLRLIDACQAKFPGRLPEVVVHCFTGNAQELETYVARDFYIGVTGFVCKQTHGAALRELVQTIPLDRLVLETDAPYMGFPHCRRHESTNAKRQSPNVPSALALVVDTVAQCLGKTPQEIARLTTTNARRFLRLAA